MSNGPVYTADDRSLLLPYYKRWLVEPTLKYIPERVHPNTITHTGHLLCFAAVVLLGMAPARTAGVLLVSMLLMQAYVWCDNADGAHARRTRQSSVFGEFLDHGLDLLNTTYIALITAFALGSSPEYTVALAILVPAAAAMTCWEQTQTGVFRMGMLNQIESVAVISGVMIAGAVFGVDVLRRVHLGPYTAYDFFHWWPFATILFGEVRRVARVAKAGHSTAPLLAFIALQAMIAVAGMGHHVSTFTAVAFAIASTLFLGLRSLSVRLQGERNRVEPLFVGATVSLGAYLALRAAGGSLPPTVGAALAAGAVVVVALSSLREARASVASLERLDVEQ